MYGIHAVPKNFLPGAARISTQKLAVSSDRFDPIIAYLAENCNKKSAFYFRFLERKLGKELNQREGIAVGCFLSAFVRGSFIASRLRAIDDRPYGDETIPLAQKTCI